MNCPDCGTAFSYTVSDDRSDKEYKHIFEICHHCGYTKAYVEYTNNDTGNIDWSGIE
jgi:RNase P subunit RPR2